MALGPLSKVFVRIGGDKLAACKDIEQHTVLVDGDEAHGESSGGLRFQFERIAYSAQHAHSIHMVWI